MYGMDISLADGLILLSGTLVSYMNQGFTTGGDDAVPVADFLVYAISSYPPERGPELPFYLF